MLRNHLAEETSPYLLQHADNPVEWYPWGEAALRKAEQENKPILLSIGYSACHWCHVMAHESFEDLGTAALMNELFINIKVDREERPDLDKIYQVAQQMLTHGCGAWPSTTANKAGRSLRKMSSFRQRWPLSCRGPIPAPCSTARRWRRRARRSRNPSTVPSAAFQARRNSRIRAASSAVCGSGTPRRPHPSLT